MPSSVVAHFSYDTEKAVLRVVYVSGSVYDYYHVPESVYKEMKATGSKGTFLNFSIKGKYAFRKIK